MTKPILNNGEKYFLSEILKAEIGNDKSFLRHPLGDEIAKKIIKKLEYDEDSLEESYLWD
jgi:hypothetical protein